MLSQCVKLIAAKFKLFTETQLPIPEKNIQKITKPYIVIKNIMLLNVNV